MRCASLQALGILRVQIFTKMLPGNLTYLQHEIIILFCLQLLACLLPCVCPSQVCYMLYFYICSFSSFLLSCQNSVNKGCCCCALRLSVHAPICTVFCLPVYLHACLSVCLAPCLSGSMSVCLHVCLSVCLFPCLSTCRQSLCRSACLSVCAPVCF